MDSFRARPAVVCALVSSALTQIIAAQTRAPETNGAETNRIAAQKYVRERLAFWQQRLALGDWGISVAFARRDELKPKTLGAISWDKKKKSAVVYVMDSSEYQLPFQQMLDDMEFTVVHELIHLELASVPRSEASRSNEEHAVNGIAEALLGLNRERQ